MTIFDTDLHKTSANYAAQSPLAFMERTAEVYPDKLAVVHGNLRQIWAEQGAACCCVWGVTKNIDWQDPEV